MNVWQIFKHWKGIRADLLAGLELFSDEQLAFRPAPKYERSVGDIARHIASAEDYWFQHVVGGQPHAQFTAEQYPTLEAIKFALADVHQKTLAFLDSLTVADLERKFTSPSGNQHSLYWIIWHVIDHECHHRGELYLCLGMLGIEGPDL
jgi:uncharacterized damage-inducible protein DinB